jgi:hypothetical protein
MAILGCTFLTLILLLFQTRLSRSLASTCAGAYVILIYLLREGSLHRLITSEHVTRGKFYTLQNVPGWQKVLAGTVLLLLLCCFIFMIVRHFRLVWTSLVKVEPWALALLLWFSVLVFSQLLDKSELNYTHFGRVLEECSECSASMFLFLSVQQIISTLKPWPDLQQPRD